MDWVDEGIVLTARRHGDADAVLHALTFEHGRHAGLVKGGAGRRLRPLLQPGNRLELEWRARLADQLGGFQLGPTRLFAAALLDDPLRLAALAQWAADYVRFELLLLAELGFAVDLATCAVTGATADLAYVSPRTGRAVTREAAGALADRLLPLPAFLVEPVDADPGQIASGLRLAGHFLRRHIFDPTDRPLPAARERLASLGQAASETA